MLSKIYHPDCKITFHTDRPLRGSYVGFDEGLSKMFAHLFDAWLGFDVNIDKIVSNDTEVVVFCTITADSGLSGSAVHHFVARDGLEVSFDLFQDSAYRAKNCKISQITAALENRLMIMIDTTSAVFKNTIMAYRSARQAGEMDHPAFMAAMQAYEGHQPGNSEAGSVVGQMIYIAIERATKWFWKRIQR